MNPYTYSRQRLVDWQYVDHFCKTGSLAAVADLYKVTTRRVSYRIERWARYQKVKLGVLKNGRLNTEFNPFAGRACPCIVFLTDLRIPSKTPIPAVTSGDQLCSRRRLPTTSGKFSRAPYICPTPHYF